MIALDGPAASGKSTVGLGVARALGYLYFDTGVLYRALAWLALQSHVDASDGPALARLVEASVFDVRPPSVDDGRQVNVWVNGRDVTWEIRSPEVDAVVSRVAAQAQVREALLAPQRAAIREPGTVMAGRDIGTVIAPEAPLKVWLSASVGERARRRSAQGGLEYAAVLAELQSRDDLDQGREVAPMVKAEDAIEVDTDGSLPDMVIARIVALAIERGAPVVDASAPSMAASVAAAPIARES